MRWRRALGASGFVLGALLSCKGSSSDSAGPSAGSGGQAASADAGGSGGSGGSAVAGMGGSSATGGKAGGGAKAGAAGAAASSGAAGGGNGTMGCTGLKKPPTIPDDWVEYTGWGCDCPVYIATGSAQPPPALEWGACDFPLPSGVVCQRLVAPEKGVGGGLMSRRTTDGRPMLQLTLSAASYAQGAFRKVIAEVDGSILLDLVHALPTSVCTWTTQAINEDKFLFRVLGPGAFGSKPNTPYDEGYVAGTLDAPLDFKSLRYAVKTTYSANWEVSADWIVRRYFVTTASPWQGGGSVTVYDGAADPQQLAGHTTTVVGKNVFVEVGELVQHGVSVWTPEKGQQPFLRYLDNSSRAIGNFGTDGKDMVWTYLADQVDEYTWKTLEVRTSPFTTDGAEAFSKERKLRSDKQGPSGAPWGVGCGYAARRESTKEFGNGMVVTRVSDGRGWIVPGGTPGTKGFLSFSSILGITCEEIFVAVDIQGEAAGVTVARIRLDSLGEGMAPDL